MAALVHFVPVIAVAPCLSDNTGDCERLKKNLRGFASDRPLIVPFSRLVKVSRRFRTAGFAGRAVVNDLPWGLNLVDFLPAGSDEPLGMALDLGTTQLAASLIGLESGRERASVGRINSQTAYGDDILTRIHYATKGDGLLTLKQEVIDDINAMAAELAAAVGCQPRDIRALAVAGNTTMVHLLMGLDPYQLCREPYIPLVNAPDPLSADELGLTLHPAAPVWVLPNIGSYFGGDLIAGIIASGMAREEKVSMLIDVGTNAEVVIGNRDWLVACAGAAGPALEGGVARMGMRAAPGAIERVTIDPKTGRVGYRTIGNQAPRGLCGSGMIDLVAALYLAQIIDLRGKFKPLGCHPRLVEFDGVPSFVVADEHEAADGRAVVLQQVDLDALMRSKAAMYSILTTLVGQVGLGFTDLATIFVAGAFGQHIDPRSAITLGMLPDLPLEVFAPIGNSSLAGARTMLLDSQAREEAAVVPGRITYIELNVNHEFMNRFSGARFIPHTDHTLFPSVPCFNE